MILTDMLQLYSAKNGSDLLFHLYDDITLDERIDKDILLMEILRRCGALTPMFNVSDTFKLFSDNFFAKNYTMFSKLIDTTEYDYNAIENYNRKEETERDNTGSNSTNGSVTSEQKVSAYDSENYEDSALATDTTTNANNTSNNETVTSNVSGNIGVMSTQDMIKQEREVVTFKVIDTIALMYQHELFTGVF